MNDLLCDTAPRRAAFKACHTETGTGPRVCPRACEIPTLWKLLRYQPLHASREAAIRLV